MLASKDIQHAKLYNQGESTLLRFGTFGQDLLNFVPADKASRDSRRDLKLTTSIHIPLAG